MKWRALLLGVQIGHALQIQQFENVTRERRTQASTIGEGRHDRVLRRSPMPRMRMRSGGASETETEIATCSQNLIAQVLKKRETCHLIDTILVCLGVMVMHMVGKVSGMVYRQVHSQRQGTPSGRWNQVSP